MKMPSKKNFGFYQRKKHDKWKEVPPPEPPLEAPVADSHAHVHTLPDPAWELVRCAANGVDFVCEICDPSEDQLQIPDDVRRWQQEAEAQIEGQFCLPGGHPRIDKGLIAAYAPSGEPPAEEAFSAEGNPDARLDDPAASDAASAPSCQPLTVPTMRIAAGVHPHNAKLYDAEVEQRLLIWLSAPETIVLGEIGLDYHYDLSPRETQRQVFRRQLELAKQLDLPVALHLRAGEDPLADDAHREAFEILSEVGFPARGTILHCCTLAPDKLQPWIDAGCYIAYGGALTFANADDARAGARLVPEDRLLLETDSPYMTPVPMRGAPCTPAHIIFTAAKLAELRGIAPGPDRARFLEQLHANTRRLLKPNQ